MFSRPAAGVIIAVADRLFPPSDEPHIDADGVSHKVGPGQYRNRIRSSWRCRNSRASLHMSDGRPDSRGLIGWTN